MATQRTWRTTYTPGSWLVLNGPQALVAARPSSSAVAARLASIWGDVVAATDLETLVSRLMNWGMDVVPDLIVIVDADGLSCVVRGNLEVRDADSGAVVADGRGQTAWRSAKLDTRHIMIDFPAELLGGVRLPLAVGVVTASSIEVDARDDARVDVRDAGLFVSARPEEPAPAASPAPAPAPEPMPAAPGPVSAGPDVSAASQPMPAPAVPMAEPVVPVPVPTPGPAPLVTSLGAAAAAAANGLGAPAYGGSDRVPGPAEYASAPTEYAETLGQYAQPPEHAQGGEAAPEPEAPQAVPLSIVPDQAGYAAPGDQQTVGVGDDGRFERHFVQTGPVPVADQFGPPAGGQQMPQPGESEMVQTGPQNIGMWPQESMGPGMQQPVMPGQYQPYPQPDQQPQSYPQQAFPQQYPQPDQQQPQQYQQGEQQPQQYQQGEQQPQQYQQNEQQPQQYQQSEQQPQQYQQSEQQPQQYQQSEQQPQQYQQNEQQPQQYQQNEQQPQQYQQGEQQPADPGFDEPAAGGSPTGATELVFSDGQRAPVGQPLLVGRAPQPFPGEEAQLIRVASPHHDISRTHVRIELYDSAIWATDRESTNGTIVHNPGQQPVTATPNEPAHVWVGGLIDIGDGLTIRVQ